MSIEVTIYLKSGGSAKSVVTELTMEELISDYRRCIDHGTTVAHQEANGSAFQIIPGNNIACVELLEVAE